MDSSGCVFSQSLTSNVMTAANVEAIHAQVQNFKIDMCAKVQDSPSQVQKLTGDWMNLGRFITSG